ncbi:hypothetical protein [Gimesia algae]|uniref:Uncharacterized protein n=1 Tax=Gimesia algae TaxID=2527971 RepID=A0A517V6D2_9PLAN|nr:hypothetical protein [Gimesia algae]QDT88554.1 hypothetical protein Pan161_01700 [Gimesia algae]
MSVWITGAGLTRGRLETEFKPADGLAEKQEKLTARPVASFIAQGKYRGIFSKYNDKIRSIIDNIYIVFIASLT